MTADVPYNPTLHRAAVLTCGGTLLLIGMGGLVTSHAAGMSVPDWPNSFGYNMFLFPPRLWIGGILYEHTHRLMGTVVGLLSVMMTLLAYAPARVPETRRLLGRMILFSLGMLVAAGLWDALRHAPVARHFETGFAGLAVVLGIARMARQRESRAWVRRLSLLLLALVLLQGALGGLRVVLVQLDLAIVHACLAQAFFCVAVLMAVATSRWWMMAPDLSTQSAAGRSLIVIASVALLVIYGQLIVGACMRHFGAGLAIPDLPLAYGKLLPPTTPAELEAANHQRAWEPAVPGRAPLGPVTLGQIWVHFGHRIGAVLVTMALAALLLHIFRRHSEQSRLMFPALVLAGLLIAQLTLGILTVLLRKPADVASLHVAVGALTLANTAVLLIRSLRLYSRSFRAGAVRFSDKPAAQRQTASIFENASAQAL